jgi:hypothetical protein
MELTCFKENLDPKPNKYKLVALRGANKGQLTHQRDTEEHTNRHESSLPSMIAKQPAVLTYHGNPGDLNENRQIKLPPLSPLP